MNTLYPRIAGSPGRRFFDTLDPGSWDGLIPVSDDLPLEWFAAPREQQGETVKYDTRPVYELGRHAKRDIERGLFDTGNASQVGERFEGAFAVGLHEMLRDLPGSVLTDRGFWRFLSLGPFFAATVWRQREKNLTTAFGLPPSSGRRRRIESYDLKRSLPWRLYMRAAIGGPSMVGIVGSDLWWSHLFGVHIGRSLPTAHALLAAVGDKPIAVQRAVASLITADRGRKVYDCLDAAEINDLVYLQYERVVGKTAGARTEDDIDHVLENEE